MTGSSAMTRRTSSRRTVWVSSKSGSGGGQCAGKPAADLGRNGGEQGGQPAPGAAQIGSGEHDAGADDADADLAGAGDGEHEGLTVQAPDGAELVARDDRRRVAGERRRIGGEVAQQRGDERARGAPQRQAHEERRRGPAGSTRSAPRSPRRRPRCRSCGTSPCAARRRDAADRRSPRWSRPSTRCRARARTRRRAPGRPTPTAATRTAAVGPTAWSTPDAKSTHRATGLDWAADGSAPVISVSRRAPCTVEIRFSFSLLDAQARDPFTPARPRKHGAGRESAPVLPVLSGRDQVTARRVGGYSNRGIVIFAIDNTTIDNVLSTRPHSP